MANENENATNAQTPEANVASPSSETKRDNLQVVIAILLAITALLTAYATWMSQLHASNEAANYAYAGRLSTEATTLAIEDSILLANDMSIWYEITSLQAQHEYYEKYGDDTAAKLTTRQIERLINACNPEFAEACRNAMEKGGEASPFDEVSTNDYYAEAIEKAGEATSVRQTGDTDNLDSDSYGLALVIYSFVMFLLGVAGVWSERSAKRVLVVASFVMLIVGVCYTLLLPMPTDFDFSAYWSRLRGIP